MRQDDGGQGAQRAEGQGLAKGVHGWGTIVTSEDERASG